MIDLRDKDVLVVGTKRSGQGAIALLHEQGAHVRAMDSQPISTEEQAKLGVPFVLQSAENIGNPQLIVLSPAVPLDAPLFVEARNRGLRVIGEVELASFYLKGPVIGITGSNGKTTTTALTGHILKECGIPVQVGGNIGTAVTSMVSTSRQDQWNVLELSSFQLESIEHFHARIGACLNVTADHLDRHYTLENYAAAKRRLFENQNRTDFVVLNWSDRICRSFAENAQADILWFSSSEMVPKGMWLDGSSIISDGTPFLHTSEIKLRGIHNIENVMAAALMALVAGAPQHRIASAVTTFPGVEHRIEFVRELDGVQYYNDSKATNVDAALKAVTAFDKNLWIILGGKDKGAGYEPLIAPLQRKAKSALLIGAEDYPYAAAPIIRDQFKDRVPFIDCGTLENAVHYARAHTQPGDTVLLSPACASFDQFESYEHRGKTFKHLVQDLL
jgi:UDP-N-acetylmuramoylalanine--D-glutamate ligase